MELRVSVDGTQRVVCGVKLTTTCQEIVFALAHATQQAGRFTMIERWRNNERLLAPNEQPLVTLQRWGDHMNEVQFILRKTASEPPQQQPNHISQQQQQQQHLAASLTPNHAVLAANHHHIRSPHLQDLQQPQNVPLTRMPNPLRPTMSHTNLSSNEMLGLASGSPSSAAGPAIPVANGAPATNGALMRMHHYNLLNDHMLNASPTSSTASLMRLPTNGYPVHNNNDPQQQQQQISSHNNQAEQNQVAKNFPYEDMYSMIDKKKPNQPPIVPAKPRLVGPSVLQPTTHLPNFGLPYHQSIQTINHARMSIYNQQYNGSPMSMYQQNNNMRPRNPPGYMEYLEAMTSRDSMTQQQMSFQEANYAQQNQQAQSNMYQGFPGYKHMINVQPQHFNSSPNNVSLNNDRYLNLSNCKLNGNSNHSLNHDTGLANSGMQNSLSKLVDSGLVINRGSAINIKLHPNSNNVSSQSIDASNNHSGVNFTQDSKNNSDAGSPVSQMGHDILKVIEEQKKVLINQKNELDRLDNNQDFWDVKQNTKQAELINRIENEIRQLEELWKENQAQLQKLEKQDFEKELHDLRSEQQRIETEIDKQKCTLSRCEADIVKCLNKIEQMEAEIASHEMEQSEFASNAGKV